VRPKCKDIAGDPKDPAAAYINDGRFFAHEVGHYLWLVHTFSWSFNSKAEYETNIRANVERQVTAYADKLGKNASDIIKNGEIPDDILKNGLSIFDADRGLEEDLKIEDTPADPGPWIFENEGMDMCKDPLEISVKFSDKQTQKYVFEVKHRKNVMSYYENNCKLFKFRFSPGQVHVMRSVLGGAKNRQLVPKPEFVWLGMT